MLREVKVSGLCCVLYIWHQKLIDSRKIPLPSFTIIKNVIEFDCVCWNDTVDNQEHFQNISCNNRHDHMEGISLSTVLGINKKYDS